MADRVQKKRIGCWGWLAIAFVVVGVTLNSILPSDAEKAAERTAKLREWSEVKVTAEDWVKAWADNEVAARSRFDSHIVVISGAVVSVAESNSDALSVALDAGQGNPVMASVDGAYRAVLGQVPVGQTVTLRCPNILEVLGVRVLAQCSVANGSAQ